MLEKIKGIQLNRKQADALFYVSLVMLGLFLFLFVGSREPVLFDDSGAYLTIDRIEGVMPVYPLFLLFNQYLFGNDCYLRVVIVEQAVLAVLCILLFVKTIKDNFTLKYWEAYLVFALSLIPFTTDLPQAMSTQEILTEGIAYALFYVWVIMLLKAVWTKRYTWLAGAFGMTLLLSMVRSQLQILFGVCGVIFLYLVCRGRKHNGRFYRLLRAVAGLVGCMMIMLVGVMMVSRIASGYKSMIRNNDKFYAFALKIQQPSEYEDYLEEQELLATQPKEELTWNMGEIDWHDAPEGKLVTRPFASSQYVSLIFSRGIYEADIEDADLFEDEILRGLFLELYEAVDAEKQRYAYAQEGLWMWKDIVGGIGMAGKTCLGVPSEYYVTYYPDIILSDDFSNIRNAHLQEIGSTLLKVHFGRFVYHTLMLLPSAFICTVFFQIAPIYGLCHLVTLFLYVSALALMIWAYVDKKVQNKYAEFMALVLGTNMVMVLIISLVFFGQQRYLVYNFGIFYVAYGLLLQQLWKCRIRDWIHRQNSKNDMPE